jgi:hypothetical protein
MQATVATAFEHAGMRLDASCVVNFTLRESAGPHLLTEPPECVATIPTPDSWRLQEAGMKQHAIQPTSKEIVQWQHWLHGLLLQHA